MSAVPSGPVTHRRRPGWPRRAGRRVGAALVILATLALGHEITSRTPERTVTAGYFLRSGGVGDRVESLDIAATVVSVRGGSAVHYRDEELHTNGVWIVTRVRLETLTEPNLLLHFAIDDRRGRTYVVTGRIFQPMTGYTLQPGIPVEADLVFELARDAVPGARLRLHPDLVGDTRYQSMIDIDLGLDEALLREFLAAEPVRPQEPEVKL